MRYLGADSSPLGQLLEKKRKEISLKIDLIEARGDNVKFQEISWLLFGQLDSSLIKDARQQICSWNKPKMREDVEMLAADEVIERFEEVLKSYGLRDWSVKTKASAVSDVSLGKKVLLVRQDALVSRERLESLIAHEIETHVLTSENGSKQPYEIFERGLAGYLETQEGLAIYNQNKVLSEQNEKRYWPAMNVLAVNYGVKHSFADLRRYIRRLGFDDARALRTCFKVKRGMEDSSKSGAFTKESVYFSGLRMVEDYVNRGGELKELYQGKINLKDMDLIRKVEGLIDPVYLPK